MTATLAALPRQVRDDAPIIVPRERAATSPETAARLFRAKEMVFLEEEPADHVYYVVEGAIRLLRTTCDGRRQLVGFASAGDWLAVGCGDHYPHTAEALADSRLRILPRAVLERRMAEDAAFLHEMLEVAAHKLRQAEDQMLLLGQRGALEKVAAFLLSFGRRLGADASEIRLPMDRSDIADYLGLTIETVSRQFTKLKRGGVISLPTPACVRLNDPGALERVAEGGARLH